VGQRLDDLIARQAALEPTAHVGIELVVVK
jgi:hypothetical protein